MPSTATDRIDGLTTSVAVKAPCVVAGTGLTLSGEQIINGVACVTGDRVLNYGTGVDVGIWVVASGAWSRAKDFDGARDVVRGTIVLVAPGTDDSEFFNVTTSGTLIPGTTSITIETMSSTAASLLVDLANTVSADKGAGMVGYGPDVAYAAGTVGAKLREIVSVTDYGSDPNTSFDEACTRIAELGGGTLVVPPGTYTFTTETGFTLPSGTRLVMHGATLDFSGAAADVRIRTDGSIGSTNPLTGNVAAEDSVIPVTSVSGLAANDLLLISSDKLVPLDDIGGSTVETIGEFVTIKSISGLNVTINGVLDSAYATSDTAVVQKITPSFGVVIEGGKIIGAGITGSDTSSTEIGIQLTYARKFVVRDLELVHTDYQAVAVEQGYDGLIDNVSVTHEERASAAHTAVIQYGVALKNATSKVTVRGGTMTGGKHGVVWTENSLPGYGRDCVIDGVTCIGTWASGIASHESNTRAKIINPRIIGCAGGIDMRVENVEIINPHIRLLPQAVSTATGILLSEATGRVLISTPDIDGARFGIRIAITQASAVPEEIVIQGGRIRNIAQQGMLLEYVGNGTAKKGITVDGVDMVDVAGDYIRLNGNFDNAIVQGCKFRPIDVSPTQYGVRVMGGTNTWIKNNHFGAGLTPVRTENDTQSVPVAPSGVYMFGNSYEVSTGFLSSTAGTNLVRQNNVQLGSASPVIAAGVITIPAGHSRITVDTEAAAASDDLDTINGGEVGDIVTYVAASEVRTVVFKDGTGNLLLNADFSLTSRDDVITLTRTAAGWSQMATADNTA